MRGEEGKINNFLQYVGRYECFNIIVKYDSLTIITHTYTQKQKRSIGNEKYRV